MYAFIIQLARILNNTHLTHFFVATGGSNKHGSSDTNLAKIEESDELKGINIVLIMFDGN